MTLRPHPLQPRTIDQMLLFATVELKKVQADYSDDQAAQSIEQGAGPPQKNGQNQLAE